MVGIHVFEVQIDFGYKLGEECPKNDLLIFLYMEMHTKFSYFVTEFDNKDSVDAIFALYVALNTSVFFKGT